MVCAPVSIHSKQQFCRSRFGHHKSLLSRFVEEHQQRRTCQTSSTVLFRDKELLLQLRPSFTQGYASRARRRAVKRPPSQTVALTVTVEPAGGNSRCCYAGINIRAPLDSVWAALTDYEGLGNFIPGLAENKCLSRHAEGARLRQVGEQGVALGAKFRAEVILDIKEWREGLPRSMCEIVNGATGRTPGKFPFPRGLAKEAPCDITFSLVKGDFQDFQGVWRMQQRLMHDRTTYLSYALYVKPQIWLPVRLIQGRIQDEIRSNLCAVQSHSEALWIANQKHLQSV